MNFRFNNKELERFFTDDKFYWCFSLDIKRAFVKKMLGIRAALNINDLRRMKGWRLEKMTGDREGQFSIRLNDQFRLFFVPEKIGTKDCLVILEIGDPHKG